MPVKTETAVTEDAFDRMVVNIEAQRAAVAIELAEARAELVTATIAAETDPTPARQKALSACESKVDKLQLKQQRLEGAARGIDERIQDARRQAELDRRKAAGAEFVAAMDTEQEHQRRVVALIDEAAAAMDEARLASRTARRAANTAFGREAVLDLLPGPAALASYAEGSIEKTARAAELRRVSDAVHGPWRPGRGPWAARLAELGL